MRIQILIANKSHKEQYKLQKKFWENCVYNLKCKHLATLQSRHLFVNDLLQSSAGRMSVWESERVLNGNTKQKCCHPAKQSQAIFDKCQFKYYLPFVYIFCKQYFHYSNKLLRVFFIMYTSYIILTFLWCAQHTVWHLCEIVCVRVYVFMNVCMCSLINVQIYNRTYI